MVIVSGRLIIEDDTKKGMDQAKKGIGGAFKDIAKSAAGFLARDVVNALVDVGQESIQLGAKAETLRTSFENMRDPVADWGLSIEGLQDAVGGTISEIDLLTAANNAMALGLPRDELDELFAAAQRVGAAMGRTTLEAVQDLTTGIGRQSKLILDNLGILVDTNAAYDDFAATLGKTAAQLTEDEKKTAFMTAAIGSLNEKAKELGDNISETQLAQERFAATMVDIKTVIGEALIPVVSDLMENFVSLVTTVLDVIEMIKEGDWEGIVSLITDIFDGLGQKIWEIIENIDWEWVFSSLGRFAVRLPLMIAQGLFKLGYEMARVIDETDWPAVFTSLISAFGSFVRGMFEELFDWLPKPVKKFIGLGKGSPKVKTPSVPTYDEPGWEERGQHGFRGMVSTPTKFITGEAGPEMVSISPIGGAGGGGGGYSITFSIGNFIGLDESSARELAQVTADIFIKELERQGIRL